jgi:pimeloyl-ACP methyl ester carboxylesterase
MLRSLVLAFAAAACCAAPCGAQTPAPPAAQAVTAPRVVDVPTRPGVTERVLYLAPAAPKAAAILFAGGNGYVGIGDDGTLTNRGNFLVRTRAAFAERGIAVAVIDPPSDRARPPYLGGFRQSAQHVNDVRALIAWLRAEARAPVWLIGTSRGTQSAAYVATQLPSAAAGGADGVVLTSTILAGSNAQDRPVPEMDLGRIAVPVLIVHHHDDGCALCPFADVPKLARALRVSPRTETIVVDGGTSTGDPCEAFAHHGFNGIEPRVVGTIADWIAR